MYQTEINRNFEHVRRERRKIQATREEQVLKRLQQGVSLELITGAYQIGYKLLRQIADNNGIHHTVAPRPKKSDYENDILFNEAVLGLRRKGFPVHNMSVNGGDRNRFVVGNYTDLTAGEVVAMYREKCL